MPRAIWKGAISFGLVTIPVKVHSALDEKSFKFNQLHKDDMGRIRYKRFCSVCEKEVTYEDIVRGYEYEKDHYVTLSDEELDRGIQGIRSIDVLKFVPRDQIDSIYFRRSYYLSPETVGLKAYKLMAKALTDDERVAIAKVSFRDKEHLATLRVVDDAFLLETMYWPDEVREPEIEGADEDINFEEQELALAKSLIDNLTGDWDGEQFKDEYREKVEALVRQKIDGKEIAVVEEAGSAKVLDLIEALKASVDATEGGEKKDDAEAAAG